MTGLQAKPKEQSSSLNLLLRAAAQRCHEGTAGGREGGCSPVRCVGEAAVPGTTAWNCSGVQGYAPGTAASLARWRKAQGQGWGAAGEPCSVLPCCLGAPSPGHCPSGLQPGPEWCSTADQAADPAGGRAEGWRRGRPALGRSRDFLSSITLKGSEERKAGLAHGVGRRQSCARCGMAQQPCSHVLGNKSPCGWESPRAPRPRKAENAASSPLPRQ